VYYVLLMSPQVIAAVIAGALTVIGTLAAQYLGRRATSRDTEKTLQEQREHLERTFAEQSRQLDRTLEEQRIRTLNERFATAAEQLGSDKPAVRLAGVYAMAGLADDWEKNRQTCVDVLCAYLRMPSTAADPRSEPAPSTTGNVAASAIKAQTAAAGDSPEQERQVRLAAQRILSEHLRKPVEAQQHASLPRFWPGTRLDLTGATLIDFSLANCVVSEARFDNATFLGEGRFFGATFTDSAWFDGAKFTSNARFDAAQFHNAWFDGVTFAGCAQFDAAAFTGSARFDEAVFSDSARFG
jgi:hypothetical protein